MHLQVTSNATAGTRTVTFELVNTGARPGAEVTMLFLTFPEAAGEPPLQLTGFEKVFLDPGQDTRVSFRLGVRDLSIFDTASRRWVEQQGVFGVSVGGGLGSLHQTVQFKN